MPTANRDLGIYDRYANNILVYTIDMPITNLETMLELIAFKQMDVITL